MYLVSLRSRTVTLIKTKISGKRDKEPDAYPVTSGMDSFRNLTIAKKVQWLGNSNEFVLIDTPGM